jgi:predicted RNA-binding protein associated with RNAse of E/G family
VRKHGVFSRESHVHQVRTLRRQILFRAGPTGPARPYSGRIHPPKHEVFDLTARTNTDPKGIVRAVDVYTVRPWGLYMARPAPGRTQFHYIESWLLPSLGLRATVFHFNPGHERDQDFYLDVGDYTAGPDRWEGVDHYLDLILRTGQDVRITDGDELLAAVSAGLLDSVSGERAIGTAVATVDALARNDYDLQRWLAGIGMALTWRNA